MSKQTEYVVRKDGLYLLNYQLSEIREFDSTGQLADVYTCVWGDGRKGAKAFKSKSQALAVMKMVDADNVDSVFAEVEMKYEALKNNQSQFTNYQSAKIMSGNNFRGTWYVPSGKNYLAYLFRDAGAQYPFYDDERATSIPLTVEETLHYFCEADVWVGAGANTLAELKALDGKHTWFKAYQNGRVYNWRKQCKAGGANNFWERGVVHPEEMLEDVIHILNNDPDSLLHFAAHLY